MSPNVRENLCLLQFCGQGCRLINYLEGGSAALQLITFGQSVGSEIWSGQERMGRKEPLRSWAAPWPSQF